MINCGQKEIKQQLILFTLLSAQSKTFQHVHPIRKKLEIIPLSLNSEID